MKPVRTFSFGGRATMTRLVTAVVATAGLLGSGTAGATAWAVGSAKSAAETLVGRPCASGPEDVCGSLKDEPIPEKYDTTKLIIVNRTEQASGAIVGRSR